MVKKVSGWLLSKLSIYNGWQGVVVRNMQCRFLIGQKERPNFLQPHTFRFWGFGLRILRG